MAAQHRNQPLSRYLGLLDEVVAADIDQAAAWVLFVCGERRQETRQRVRLQRTLYRELAYMIGLAVNGQEIPDIEPTEEGETGGGTGCVWGGCKECVTVKGKFKGCPESDEIRRVFGENVSAFVESVRAEGRHE